MSGERVVWEGPDQLRSMLVPIGSLRPDPDNTNTHPEKNLNTIRSSLGRYGQQKPIVVGSDGVIAAGNGMWTVLQEPIVDEDGHEAQWTHVAAIESDLTPEQLVEYGIVDNRSGELAEWDVETLARRLRIMDDDLALALGFDEADLAKLLPEVGDLDPNAEWEDMPEFEQDDLQSAYRVTVHFASDEDADEFFEMLGRDKVSFMWWPETDGHVGSSLHEEYVQDEAAEEPVAADA